MKNEEEEEDYINVTISRSEFATTALQGHSLPKSFSCV